MEAIGRLAGIVAHDFNNLLTVVLGHSEMLLETFGESGATRSSVLEIKNAAEMAARITNQLLAVSSRQALALSDVDVNDVIRDLADTLHQLAGGEIDLRFDLASELPLIEGDVKQLERVLRNLVVDAREALSSGGRITVATRATPRGKRLEVALTVSDTRPAASGAGGGYAFEPAFASKRLPRGSGLNRAAIYGIVTQTGGRIAVSSPAAGGLTFTIFLPAKSEQNATGN
jgi:two-component system cell cycle sensor histidine kinase/response regulator CckA